MRTSFPFLSKFLSKIIEIVGAGLASAAGAYLLSQIVVKPADPPSLVQIVPADADTLRRVLGDQTVADGRQNEVPGPKKAEAEAVPAEVVTPQVVPAKATASAPAPAKVEAAPVKAEKVNKVVHAPPARRERKVESTRVEPVRVPVGVEAPPRIAGQIAEQPPLSQVGAAADLPAPTEATGEGRFRLFTTLRQIPGWFLPNIDRSPEDAPRPPMPVGQFWQGTM